MAVKKTRKSDKKNEGRVWEVEPLSDESLEEVAGGICSISHCSAPPKLPKQSE